MGRYEIRLSGAGGQGLILAGFILAEAVVRFTDQEVIQTQSYGPEARGGASKAEVIISDEEIDYPQVTKPDFLLALTQEAYNKYNRDLKEYGTMIVDERVDAAFRGGPTYVVPIQRKTQERLGTRLVVNVVSLALFNHLHEVVPVDKLQEAVLERVPRGTEDLNKKALELGQELAQELNTYKVFREEEEVEDE